MKNIEELHQCLQWHHKPHWAVQLLLDPREDLPELEPGLDYPASASEEEALGLFDQSQPGWVPTWFPHQIWWNRWTDQEQVENLNSDQRLAWFDKALAHYAQKEWPPQGSLNSKKRAVAQSLLRMYRAAQSEEIPTPNKM